VKSHSVFLRNGCVLPNRLDPLSEPVGDHWARVEELDALIFDTMIRQAGWHFMWIQNSCARRGVGIIRQNAIDRALIRALGSVAGRFNAAELDSVQVAKYMGFHVATVTVQTRQIQEQTSLDCPNDI
jgi:hypothetical protein